MTEAYNVYLLRQTTGGSGRRTPPRITHFAGYCWTASSMASSGSPVTRTQTSLMALRRRSTASSLRPRRMWTKISASSVGTPARKVLSAGRSWNTTLIRSSGDLITVRRTSVISAASWVFTSASRDAFFSTMTIGIRAAPCAVGGSPGAAGRVGDQARDDRGLGDHRDVGRVDLAGRRSCTPGHEPF